MKKKTKNRWNDSEKVIFWADDFEMQMIAIFVYVFRFFVGSGQGSSVKNVDFERDDDKKQSTTRRIIETELTEWLTNNYRPEVTKKKAAPANDRQVISKNEL